MPSTATSPGWRSPRTWTESELRTIATQLHSFTTVVGGSNITDDTRKENGGSENSTELVEDVAQVWLIMLYSPLCGMSRAIRPYVEATAEILKADHNVKVS